ncbi:ABC transporter permease [Candidatus Bipolaricaulota bacterium]|nr:ABC transporter permease [Candidatus Bipolaricaulota bacterium]
MSRGHRVELVLVVAVAVAILTLGLAMLERIERDANAMVEAMGANLARVFPNDDHPISAEEIDRLEATPGVNQVVRVSGGMCESYPGQILRLWYREVTPNYFEVLGLRFAYGGPFDTSGTPQAVLGWDVYEALYDSGGDDPTGTTLGGITITGVLEETTPGDLWVWGTDSIVLTPPGGSPLRSSPTVSGEARQLLIRVDPGGLQLLDQLAADHPEWRVETTEDNVAFRSSARMRPVIVAVFGGALLAAIATVGVVVLMTLGITTRMQEWGIRRSVGASRAALTWDIVREALATLTTGTAIGCIVGLAIASATGNPWSTWHALLLPSAAGLAVLAALFPARLAMKEAPAQILAQRSLQSLQRSTTIGLAVATTIALIIATGGLGAAASMSGGISRTIDRLWGDLDDRTFIVFRGIGQDSVRPIRPLEPQDRALLEAVSGVEATIEMRAFSVPVPGEPVPWAVAAFEPGFEDLHLLEIVEGRDLQAADFTGTQLVGLVAERLAEEVFGDPPWVGRILEFRELEVEVVGVYSGAIGEGFWHEIVVPEMALPPHTSELQGFVVRAASTASMTNVRQGIEAAFQQAYPRYQVPSTEPLGGWRVRTYNGEMARIMERLIPQLVLAALLACVVLASVIRFFLRNRMQELGIRRAFGARRGQMISLGGRFALQVSFAGVALGCLAAFAAAQPLATWFGLLAEPDLIWIAVLLPSALAVLAMLGAGIAWITTGRPVAWMLQRGRE